MRDRELMVSLVTALLDGPYESPLWESFLERLRCATDADYAILNFRPIGRPLREMLHLMSGGSAFESMGFLQERFDVEELPLATESLVEGRVYSMQDLLRYDPQGHLKFYHEFLLPNDITALRHMRVQEPTGVNAWLSVVRSGKDFTRREATLMRDIAPILRSVLRNYVTSEREKFNAALTAEAVRRLQFGWVLLDRRGQILGCDDQGALTLSTSNVISRNAAGRLIAKPAMLNREVSAAIQKIAETPNMRPLAIVLCREPWLDMLIVPAPDSPHTARNDAPTAIAYVHSDSWNTSDRCKQLAEMFSLAPREARLALGLCRGMSISEAAAEYGLTMHTARTYLKNIYAKTGARGLADLVRIVMRSVLAIAPEF